MIGGKGEIGSLGKRVFVEGGFEVVGDATWTGMEGSDCLDDLLVVVGGAFVANVEIVCPERGSLQDGGVGANNDKGGATVSEGF